MSYETIEAGLKTLLEGVTGFTSSVYLDEVTSATAGVEKFINLRYNSFTHRRETFDGFDMCIWTIEIRLYVRHQSKAQVRNDMRDARELILAKVRLNPKLNATAGVFDAFITRGQRGEEEVVFGQARFFEEILFIEVSEDVEVDALE